MTQTIKKQKHSFEESYFKGWYKAAVGDFTNSDLEIQKNWFWAWLQKLNQYVPMYQGNGTKVLEIGCSIGAVTNLLVERGFDVWSTDISSYAVKHAKKLTPKAHFSTLDIQKKITLKEKFDVILAFEVVEHLEKPELAIKNMYDGLRKGGILVVSTPYPYKWNFHDPTHINVKYPNEWEKMLQEAGLKKVAYHRFTLIPFFYRLHHRLQLIIPFAIPLPYLNSPIFFIGKK